MRPTLWKASLRHLLRHPWQFGLSLVGIALGVAVVVSIDLTNGSASRAFDLSTEAVSGRATHRIVAGPGGVDEGLYTRLRLDAGLRGLAPVVEGWATVPGEPPRALRVLGLDPLAEGPFRGWLAPAAGGLELGPLLTEPGAFVTTTGTARELGLQVGDTVAVDVASRSRDLVLVGTVQPAGVVSGEALADLALVDVSTAQEVLGRLGRLSRIDVLLAPPGADGPAVEAAADALADLLPAGARLIPAGAFTGVSREMTRAFRTNLTALSLLALVCGTFLIYNTMTFSVVQRRQLIGALRSLGVTRRAVFALVMAEAAAVGLAGTLLGLAGGTWLAGQLLALVTRTINDLYFTVSVQQVALSPASLAKGLLLGVGATVLAALAPAREATATTPGAALRRSSLESRARRAAPRAALAGVALMALGGLLLVAARPLPLSFVGLFLAILGFAGTTPWLVVGLMRAATPPARLLLGSLGAMATRGVVATLSRTAVAVAALMIAVAVIIGVGVMIDSFRRTVVAWLDATLQADLYVSAPGGPGRDAVLRLAPGTLGEVGALPGVEAVGTVRGVTLETRRGPLRVVAFRVGPRGRSGFELLAGEPGTVWEAFDRGAVLVTESFAYRHDLAVGDTVALPTDGGLVDFPVAGVYASYASDRGFTAMADDVYRRHFDDDAISGFSIYATPDADLAALTGRVRAALGDRPVSIQSHRDLRRASLEVFDRTFLITGVLRALVTVVAFIGVLGALMALQLERAREIGVLRAIGLTPRQVWTLVTSQSGLMGLAAGLLALPLGCLLAVIMIFVINRRSFGWTLRMELSPAILALSLLVAVGAALLAGVIPAARMARVPPSAALREE